MKLLLLAALLPGLVFGQATASFPSAITTWQKLMAAKNASQSTLAAAVTDTTGLSWTVVDGSQFIANEAIVVGSEVTQICSIATNVLTLCTGSRGLDGSTAATHLNGSLVSGANVAGGPNNLSAEVIAIETLLGVFGSTIIAAASPTGVWGYAEVNTSGIPASETIQYMMVNRLNRAVTIQEVWCITNTGTVTLSLLKNNSGAVATSNPFTCSTTANVITTLTNASIGAGDYISHIISAISGSPSQLTVAVRYQ